MLTLKGLVKGTKSTFKTFSWFWHYNWKHKYYTSHLWFEFENKTLKLTYWKGRFLCISEISNISEFLFYFDQLLRALD